MLLQMMRLNRHVPTSFLILWLNCKSSTVTCRWSETCLKHYATFTWNYAQHDNKLKWHPPLMSKLSNTRRTPSSLPSAVGPCPTTSTILGWSTLPSCSLALGDKRHMRHFWDGRARCSGQQKQMKARWKKDVESAGLSLLFLSWCTVSNTCQLYVKQLKEKNVCFAWVRGNQRMSTA